MGFFDRFFGSTGGDGSSAEEAVIVQSVAEEYDWVRRNCPGFSLDQQALVEIEGKPYDVLELRNEAGEERTIYFDVSSFYGQL